MPQLLYPSPDLYPAPALYPGWAEEPEPEPPAPRPMTYATRDQMVELFGEERLAYLSGGVDPDTGSAVVNESRLAAVIRAAQAEVDGYFEGVAPLPLARVPEAVRLHACYIAYYHLDPAAPTEGAQQGYKAAIRFLERVQDGKAGLGLDDQAEPVARSAQVHVRPGNSAFRDAMGDFTRAR